MKWKLTFAIVAFIMALYFQILGMLNLVPIILTTPVLFLVIFLIMYVVNNRNRFKGYTRN
ncbi:hypothetical protein ACOI1C_08090 [Bacillus sp. DJP31]|uniref:hypothetical protein n=1 Tax=Bacillus sp. DJP31 TaxID=3409789 RepID=UPI003BB4913C